MSTPPSTMWPLHQAHLQNIYFHRSNTTRRPTVLWRHVDYARRCSAIRSGTGQYLHVCRILLIAISASHSVMTLVNVKLFYSSSRLRSRSDMTRKWLLAEFERLVVQLSPIQLPESLHSGTDLRTSPAKTMIVNAVQFPSILGFKPFFSWTNESNQ